MRPKILAKYNLICCYLSGAINNASRQYFPYGSGLREMRPKIFAKYNLMFSYLFDVINNAWTDSQCGLDLEKIGPEIFAKCNLISCNLKLKSAQLLSALVAGPK